MVLNKHNLPDWEIQVISPGRVNLLGEHVDYNQGMVLPIAINRYVRLAARRRTDSIVSVESLAMKQQIRFSLDQLDQRVDCDGQPLPGWALYPAGVAWVLRQSGLEVSGLDAVIASDLPAGAGLSSSAALELAFGMAWQTAAGWNLERMRLAQICQLAENRYVGVNSGLMDQFACAHGVARHALLFDTRSLQWQPLPLPPHTAVVIADSGIQRQLSNSGYNERRAACEAAVRGLKTCLPEIHSLRDVTLCQLDEFEHFLPVDVRKKARHVVEEIERVRRAAVCLAQDDAVGFGRLMNESHVSLRDYYEVSLPELDILVEEAAAIAGCFGARLTGAGFGGCTVNLVEEAVAGNFTAQLKERAGNRLGRDVPVYVCQPSRGVHLAGT